MFVQTFKPSFLSEKDNFDAVFFARVLAEALNLETENRWQGETVKRHQSLQTQYSQSSVTHTTMHQVQQHSQMII